MARIKTIAALLAAGSALAACGPLTPPQLAVHNPSINSINQPVVQRTDYVMDVGTGPGGVPDEELLRLTAWFESLRLGYGDRVFVDGGYAGEAARADVGRVVGEFGMLLSEGAPVTAGGTPGAARVVVSRSVASVPGCPNWEYADLVGEPITTDTNFGCAVNSNLAAMVADPSDLVRGQEGRSVSDPRDGAKAITSYRNRVLSGFNQLKSESTGGSK